MVTLMMTRAVVTCLFVGSCIVYQAQSGVTDRVMAAIGVVHVDGKLQEAVPRTRTSASGVFKRMVIATKRKGSFRGRSHDTIVSPNGTDVLGIMSITSDETFQVSLRLKQADIKIH